MRRKLIINIEILIFIAITGLPPIEGEKVKVVFIHWPNIYLSNLIYQNKQVQIN